ncbi:hypothetical protein IPZ58_28235 [Streptomyces roseoverticillatus]|uniref:hypothetical protein n=1 Tax=Streptomyces roseoverticillatus TaxID=66429 RepID=UPI001F3783F1|nr:hypothetical protein [Streptomyces roseoverticillatus]MCF3105450.1 hypothetical protein [Streptomyces roseoverticillatus]
MTTTRRMMLGGAVAVPMLGLMASPASASVQGGQQWGTVTGGWVEVWWTPQAQAELDRIGATVEATTPAELVQDGQNRGVRFPVAESVWSPSPTNLGQVQGRGALAGGLSVRARRGEVRLSDMKGFLQGEEATGRYTVNGTDAGVHPVFRVGLAEGRFTMEPAGPGQAVRMGASGVPLYPTKETLEAFSRAFDMKVFSADTSTALAHVTAEGQYAPPHA